MEFVFDNEIHPIFALHAISRKKQRYSFKQNFITTVQKYNYDNILFVNNIFHLPTTNYIESTKEVSDVA